MSGVFGTGQSFRHLVGRALKRWLRPLLPQHQRLALRYFIETQLFGWEREVRVLSRFARGGPVAIDVGANWGIWTYGMVRSGLFERVIAFEPNLGLAAELESALLPGVELRNEAVSRSFGELDLKVPVRGGQVLDGWGTVESGSGLEPEEFIRFRVPSLTLDSLGLSGVGFIKIDVEGHELAVLEGARETLRAWRPDCLVECKGARLAETESFFRALGVGYERLEDLGRHGVTLSPDNYFFSSRQRPSAHASD